MAQPGMPTEVSLTLFGGVDQSLQATDLPEGLSPAANDMIFGPGFTATRPCLSKLFAAPFAGNPSVLYGKKYVQANGLPLNLYLDANGVLHQEDPVNNLGVATTVAQLPTTVKTFKSVSLDGVEWMAFSDGIHPVYPPMFYDTYLGIFDRISKDGVGVTAMAVADIVTQVNVSSITLPNLGGSGNATATESGFTVTVTTNTPHGLTEVAGFVLLFGFSVAGYNGVFQIQSIPSTTTFTVVNAGSGLGNANGGTVALATPTVTTSANHTLNVGDAVVLSGTGGGFDNGTNQTSNTPVPSFWDVVQIVSPTVFKFSLIGLNGQGSLNTTTIATSGAAGNAQIGGMGVIGTHQIACSFLWRGGYVTKPSQPVYFTSTGHKQWQVTNIPLGPTGVMARILHFTGAGGGNFFSIPVNVQLPGNSLLFNGANAPSTIVPSTWILDNTTTSLLVDFPDTTLFTGLAADIPGNNLFQLAVLGPCLGFEAYASRLAPWGAFNKIDLFWGMGFESGITSGSPNAPLGWSNPPGEFALVAGLTGFGLAGQITGDGSGNNKGLISQSAFQNYLFQPILPPNIQFTFWVMAKASAANIGGNLIAEFFSPGSGSLAKAQIAINGISSTQAQFYSATFSAATPAVIPADTILRIYENGMANGATITYDEAMIVFTNQPYKDRLFNFSYANDFESFDSQTSALGSADDPNPIRDTFILHESLWILTAKRLHVTRDANVEPGAPNGGWTVSQREDNVGAPSIHSATTGIGWAAWLTDTGKYLAARAFAGGDSGKISREMQTTFQSVNVTAKQTAWLQNVDEESRMYAGIATGAAVLPNTMAVLDYFYSETAGEIIANRPLHIGFTGKMLTTDLGRKWNTWNLALNFGSILARGARVDQFAVGGNFGNVYIFDPTKLTDDDYGQMFPLYTTYFFVNHDMEQQLQFGSKRKLFGGEGKPLTLFISGTGKLVITPLVNTVANKWVPVAALQGFVLSKNQADDIELPIEVDGRRCALQITVVPAAGAASPTDVQFTLSHLTMPIMKHPVSPTAGVSKGNA